VFFSLGQLKEGDEIEIQRVDGSIAVFAVTKLERPEQSSFPTREVYGDINHAGLRLITCTGVYDRDVLRYSHNLIVYAKLVATRAGE
jgi:sortase (surface protein transpeptidase)